MRVLVLGTYRDSELLNAAPAARHPGRAPSPGRGLPDRPGRPRRHRRGGAHGGRRRSHARRRRDRASPMPSTARPTATRSSSARCCATSPRPGPSTRTPRVDGRRTTRSKHGPARQRPRGHRRPRAAASATDAERVLSIAAVIGRDFDLDLLARATKHSEDDAARHPRSRRSSGPGPRAGRRTGPLQLLPRPDPAHAV